jgi:hypothetical protein
MTPNNTLRLPRLPDRTPVKVTLSLEPDLFAALGDYAALYKESYGETARIQDLAPVMIEAFLASDAGFKRARRALQDKPSSPSQPSSSGASSRKGN